MPILIAGPTASGKSALALALAARNGSTIVNADSMQIYDAAPVLTSRPTADDLTRARHRLYGFVPAIEAYSVGRWLGDVSDLLATTDAPLIFAGGSGLYFNVLTEGFAEIPDLPTAVRARWRTASDRGVDLYAALARRDPEMAARLRPSDTQRIIRALEVIDGTGRSLAEWQSARSVPLIPLQSAIRIVVAPPRDVLYARIDARFDAMIESGALDEVRALAEMDLDPSLPLARALGVRPLMAHVRGGMSLDDAIVRAKTDSRRYAKRQMTWLRRFMRDWNWVETPEEGMTAAHAARDDAGGRRATLD